MLPSYLHLWHNELFDRAMIFVATYLDLFAGSLCIYGFSTVVN
jgi:hypothetical protein